MPGVVARVFRSKSMSINMEVFGAIEKHQPLMLVRRNVRQYYRKGLLARIRELVIASGNARYRCDECAGIQIAAFRMSLIQVMKASIVLSRLISVGCILILALSK